MKHPQPDLGQVLIANFKVIIIKEFPKITTFERLKKEQKFSH